MNQIWGLTLEGRTTLRCASTQYWTTLSQKMHKNLLLSQNRLSDSIFYCNMQIRSDVTFGCSSCSAHFDVRKTICIVTVVYVKSECSLVLALWMFRSHQRRSQHLPFMVVSTSMLTMVYPMKLMLLESVRNAWDLREPSTASSVLRALTYGQTTTVLLFTL